MIKVNPKTLISHKILAIEGTNRASDEFRLLRTRILQLFQEKGWNTLMITGFGPGEGKSTIAFNLAITFAKDVNHTVCLVDLDLRKPSIHKMLGFEAEQQAGLSNYLLGKKTLAEVLIEPGIDNLKILLAGQAVPHAPEWLDSPAIKTMLEELGGGQKDRFIIFDLPDLATYPDALIFSKQVEAVLLVARKGKTKRGDVKKAMGLIPREKLLGIVFNNV